MSPPEKTQEQRIEDAAKVLHHRSAFRLDQARIFARDMLAAADAPPKPRWPTDESIAALNAATRDGKSSQREIVRAAMLTDPIIKAAIAYRDAMRDSIGITDAPDDLMDAVNQAGL